MSANATTSAAVSPDQLTKIYIRIRTKREELKAAFDAEDKILEEKMDRIRAALLDHCKEYNIDSFRTEHGTVYRTQRRRMWTSDWSAMHEFIHENRLFDFLERRLHQGNVSQYLEENPEAVLPGLNVDASYTVSIRKK